MTRLLLLVLIAYLVWQGVERLLERWRALQSGPPRASRPTAVPPHRPRSADTVEPLVRCAGCGVHVPRSRTLTTGGRLYCSEECRRRAAQSA